MDEQTRLEERLRRARSPRGRADAMIALAGRLFPDDIPRAATLNAEGLALCRELGYNRGAAIALKQGGMCLSAMGQGDEAATAFEESIRIFNVLGDPSEEATVLAYRGDAQARQGAFEAAMESAEAARQLAEASGGDRSCAIAFHVIGVVYLHQGKHREALPWLTDALQLRRRSGDPVATLSTLNALGVACRQEGSLARALEFGQEALALCQREPGSQKRFLGGCLTNLATVYCDIGDYRKSLELSLEAARIAERGGVPQSLAIAYQNIADIHRTLEEFTIALDYYQQALAIYVAIGNEQLRGRCLGSIGEVYGEMGDHRREMDCLAESHEVALRLGAPTDIMLSHEHLGQACYRNGNLAEARRHFLASLDQARATESRYMEVSLLLLAGRASLDLKEFSRAIDLLSEGERISVETGSDEYIGELRHYLAQAYHGRMGRGDAAAALEHYAASARLRQESLWREGRKAIMELQVRFDVERTIKEKEKLAMEVKHKSKELAAMAVHLAEKNEIIENVRRQINQAMKALHGTSRPLLRSLLMDLERNGGSAKGWNDFQKQFSLVHGQFLGTLSKRYPDLTQAELKVCALLKLQLSTKEIAGFLRVTPRAIDKHRNAIRRKLGLGAEVNLAGYLGEV